MVTSSSICDLGALVTARYLGSDISSPRINQIISKVSVNKAGTPVLELNRTYESLFDVTGVVCLVMATIAALL